MIIGISGGIGSGKSVVSRILRLKGYEVYDCDSQAKRLMSESKIIKERISKEISSEVTDGKKTPDRRLLAEIVFNDERKRLQLNDIVHGAVLEDVTSRCLRTQVLWVESAILAESGLADKCDRIWRVKTSYDRCLKNVMMRDGCSEEQAIKRIQSQKLEEDKIQSYESKIDFIFNDVNRSLLNQIDSLLCRITS